MFLESKYISSEFVRNIGGFKLHFEWAIHVTGLVYALVTIAFIEWYLFLLGLAVLTIPYVSMVILSYWSSSEPLEE
jgi:hypothetical protein